MAFLNFYCFSKKVLEKCFLYKALPSPCTPSYSFYRLIIALLLLLFAKYLSLFLFKDISPVSDPEKNPETIIKIIIITISVVIIIIIILYLLIYSSFTFKFKKTGELTNPLINLYYELIVFKNWSS